MSTTTHTDPTHRPGRGRRRPRTSSPAQPAQVRSEVGLGDRSRGVMGVTVARGIAHASHQQGSDRRGAPIIEHVARVAAQVPLEAQTVAWLHDVLERSPVTLGELREQGLGEVDCEALALLTRRDDESYELHVLRIAYAPGAAGRIARIVRLADLDDHLAQPWACGDPPYRWARRHVGNAAAITDVV